MRKRLQIANSIALIVTIIINYLSNTGVFNESTMATVSAKYQNLFTPAGYAFSIWGLIYLGLLGFVIYQGRGLFSKGGGKSSPRDAGHGGGKGGNVKVAETDPLGSQLVGRVGWWFVVSCAANCLWVLAWLYDYTGFSVLIMIGLLIALIKIILRTDMELTDPPLKTIAFVWWPFCLYSGWISVALIADIAAWLTKVKWNGFSIQASSWAIIMICVAGTLHLVMTWKRNMREFAFVGAWALVAVAVANLGRVSAVAETGFGFAAILVASSSIHGWKNRKFNPWRRRVLPLLFLLLAGLGGRTQDHGITLSGRVVDPYSHKGIGGVYVSFLGEHATGFMGGTEYLDDLLLDTTDAQGNFQLRIPKALVDSFVMKEGGPVSLYRFGLDVRMWRHNHDLNAYMDQTILSEFLRIDTGFNFYDRNRIDIHTLILTGKNQRVKKDTMGMVIKLYRGAALHFDTANDTSYAGGSKLLHVVVRNASGNGRVASVYLDKPSIDKQLLLPPNTSVDVILSKWDRVTQKDDTLRVLRGLQLMPKEVKAIRL